MRKGRISFISLVIYVVGLELILPLLFVGLTRACGPENVTNNNWNTNTNMNAPVAKAMANQGQEQTQIQVQSQSQNVTQTNQQDIEVGINTGITINSQELREFLQANPIPIVHASTRNGLQNNTVGESNE